MVSILKKKLLLYLIKDLKCWGVIPESDLPPEFIISFHAEEEIKERFKCAPHKMKRIILKAWKSKELVPLKYRERSAAEGERYIQYRLFNGFIFIFKTILIRKYGFIQKKLITVYNPKHL